MIINNDWDKILNSYFKKNDFESFMNKIKKEYEMSICYPKFDDIFNAFKFTPYKEVKVVIVGQDPYHGEGEAHGLSFSVKEGIKIPPSLKNIYKELNSDLGIPIPKTGDLTKWSKEGILLLNSVLTVKKDRPLSHKNLGWEQLTDYVIETLNLKEKPIVFILWGNNARNKKSLITNKKHLIIESVHPSPFSARNGFFGSKPFSKTNDFLKKNNYKEINFSL